MLASVSDIQKYTGVYPETNESQQELFLSAANDIICSYLGYNPESSTKTKLYCGNGKKVLRLGSKPVTAVTSVSFDGIAQTLSDFSFGGDCLVYNGGNFPVGEMNISVTFTSGFSTVPGIMQLTALRIAGILQTESGNNIGINSKSFQNEGTRTFVNTTNFDKYLSPLSVYRLV